MTPTDDTPRLTAAKAVLVGHLVVNLPVVIVIVAGWIVGSANGHRTSGLLVGGVIGWAVWSFLVPRWRDWAATTNAPPEEVQRLAQQTGLVWGKGSTLERTEMRRKSDPRR